VEYIYQLAPTDAVFADIGAGTGKFTELLARYGNKVFAVEPNTDMREQLAIALAQFPNATIVDGSAEATKLPDNSVDVIACAQALNRFDLHTFRVECQRIGKSNPTVVCLFNYNHKYEVQCCSSNYKQSTGDFFKNPTVREFPNPVFFTRDSWLLYFTSMSIFPLAADAEYGARIAEISAIFDRDSVDGVLRLDFITKVYSERMA